MLRSIRLVSCLALTVAMVVTGAAAAHGQQQPDPDSPRYKGVVALEELFATTGDDALAAFVTERLAASVTENTDTATLTDTLRQMRDLLGGGEAVGAMPISTYSAEIIYELSGGGEQSVSFALDADDPDRFTRITVGDLEVG